MPKAATSKRTTHSGFTLIELLVSITLLVILGGAGVAGYRNTARKSAVEGTQGQIVGMLRQAQTNAQSGKKVSCVTALDGWQVVFTASTATLQEKCGVNVYDASVVTFAPNVTVANLPSPNPILFKVLNRGTNVVSQTGVGIVGFGLTKVAVVSTSGEVRTSDVLPTPTPTALPTPTPPPPGGGNPTPTPTPLPWTFCANENSTCSFSGTKQVRYGANGSYNYGTYSNSVACTNAVFGDPINGVYKQCHYQ